MKYFKTILTTGEPVTVHVTGIQEQLDIPNQEPDNTKIVHMYVYNEDSTDITDLLDHDEYHRIVREALNGK